MISEQLDEATRAAEGINGPLLPETYSWIKRLDRDIGLFGDDK